MDCEAHVHDAVVTFALAFVGALGGALKFLCAGVAGLLKAAGCYLEQVAARVLCSVARPTLLSLSIFARSAQF